MIDAERWNGWEWELFADSTDETSWERCGSLFMWEWIAYAERGTEMPSDA